MNSPAHRPMSRLIYGIEICTQQARIRHGELKRQLGQAPNIELRWKLVKFQVPNSWILQVQALNLSSRVYGSGWKFNGRTYHWYVTSTGPVSWEGYWIMYRCANRLQTNPRDQQKILKMQQDLTLCYYIAVLLPMQVSHWMGRTGCYLQLNLRNNWLKFKTSGNLPIISEESIEYTPI